MNSINSIVGLSLSFSLTLTKVVDIGGGVANVGGGVGVVSMNSINSIVGLSLGFGLTLAKVVDIGGGVSNVGGGVGVVSVNSINSIVGLGLGFTLAIAIDMGVACVAIGVAHTTVTNPAIHSVVEVRISLSFSLGLAANNSKENKEEGFHPGVFL